MKTKRSTTIFLIIMILFISGIELTSLARNIQSNSNCIRGKAAPIIKKSVSMKTTFQLQPDSLTAIETVYFINGDKLIIRNWGCEYYILTFRFETARFQSNPKDLQFWFKRAVLLVSELDKSLDAPIDVMMGINKLKKYIDGDQPNNYQNLKLGRQIDFGGNEIRNFVTIDKIEKLTDKKFAVEISLATGPL